MQRIKSAHSLWPGDILMSDARLGRRKMERTATTVNWEPDFEM